jgi:hypothetical protein
MLIQENIMANCLGRNWKKQELLAIVGDPAQVAGATPFVLADGKAEGVKGIRVDTGGGLCFTVLPGRGLDIAAASFRGRALSFLSGTGITSPGYYDEPGDSWLRGFFAGLLTTCGIANSGHPTADQGRAFGLHGRVSNAGAEDLAIDQEWQGDEYLIRVKGRVREVMALAGENLTLTRRLETRLGAKGFTLQDVVENRGFDEQPLMLLYHCNFGFPLLGPNARIVAPVRGVEPRDEQARAERGVEEALVFPAPIPNYKEKVFFLDLAADRQDRTFVGLANPDVGDGTPLGLVLRFNRRELPAFTVWKNPLRGFYVLGLEPGTVGPLGRGTLRERGELPMLAGQSSYSLKIEFQVLDTAEELKALEKEAAGLR